MRGGAWAGKPGTEQASSARARAQKWTAPKAASPGEVKVRGEGVQALWETPSIAKAAHPPPS